MNLSLQETRTEKQTPWRGRGETHPENETVQKTTGSDVFNKSVSQKKMYVGEKPVLSEKKCKKYENQMFSSKESTCWSLDPSLNKQATK